MACGLAYIHSKHIIHRDLCGDNILLKLTRPAPVAMISDFGMSRLYDSSKLSSTLTAIGHRRGYLPPEAFRLEEEKYDTSLDVFSYGVIVAQIICKLESIKSAKDRSFYVSQIPRTHRLRKLIDSCLKEDMRRRPSARDICESIGWIVHIMIMSQYFKWTFYSCRCLPDKRLWSSGGNKEKVSTSK